MRLSVAIVGGAVIAIAAWWWSTREEREQARIEREHRAAAQAENARPKLYRWRDARGVLQITEQPPSGKDAGRRYEKVDLAPREGIEVRGDRSGTLPGPE